MYFNKNKMHKLFDNNYAIGFLLEINVLIPANHRWRHDHDIGIFFSETEIYFLDCYQFNFAHSINFICLANTL